MKIDAQRELRLYQTIALRIARLIEENARDAGWRMPSERELAELLAVSRPVIREAIIALEMRGIVQVHGRAGIVVLNTSTADLNFEGSGDSGPGPFEVLEASLAIETNAAKLAAHKATAYDLAFLTECIHQMERVVVGTQTQSADGSPEHLFHDKGEREFHLHIVRMTGNGFLMSSVQRLWDIREHSPMWKQLYRHLHQNSMRPLSIGDHYAILESIRIRNGDAAYNAMWRHISGVIQQVTAMSQPAAVERNT